jgi:hypothetical protein
MAIKLIIPKPCHQNWQSMAPNEHGRHCMACQKTVVDFSMMTDKEILDYISNAHGEICGRIDPHQLNRRLHENGKRKRFSFIYMWNLVIMLFVFAGKTKAQGGIKYQKITQVKKTPAKEKDSEILNGRTIHGQVLDALSGEPIIAATVMLKGSQIGTHTDTSGKFSLQVPVWGHETELEISSVGFETATFTGIDSDKDEQVCNLSPNANALDTFKYVLNTSVMGGLRTISTTRRWVKIKREVREWFPAVKKDVVIYPNPISAGENIQAALQLQEKGEYQLQLVDAGGRVMWMRNMSLNESKYNISIPTQSLWSAGVYWLRISGRHTKKIYHGKIVLQ